MLHVSFPGWRLLKTVWYYIQTLLFKSYLKLKWFMCSSFSFGNFRRKQATFYPRSLIWFCSLRSYKWNFWNLPYPKSTSEKHIKHRMMNKLVLGQAGHSIVEVNAILSWNCLTLNTSVLGKPWTMLLLVKQLHSVNWVHFSNISNYRTKIMISCECWSFDINLPLFHSFYQCRQV